MSGSEALRQALVARMDADLGLSPALREAFLAVPRERFLPGRPLEEVYRDEAIVTRKDAAGAPTSSSSQPTMMALMLEALRVEPGQRVLEIGAGTGYNAALLARLVGPQGRVVSVDVDAATADEARRALRAERARVEVVAADGRDGFAAGAPYDRIVVTASAARVYPAWWSQLVDGGLLEVPLRLGEGVQPVVTFRREGARLLSTSVLCGAFMTMRDATGASLTAPEHGISVSERGGASGVGVRLSGGALAGLGPAERRALVRLFLDEPRACSPVVDVPFWSLGLYLSLTTPASRFLSIWPAGVGVATPDGRGAAVVVAREPGGSGRPRTHELRAYGDPAAEAELRRRLAHWEALGGPGERELALTVDLADGTPRLRRRWRRGTLSAPAAP